MGKIDYYAISREVFSKIKQIRNEYNISDIEDAMNSIKEEVGMFFDIGGETYSNYNFVISQARQYVYDLLKSIIISLYAENGILVTDYFDELMPNQQYKRKPILDLFKSYSGKPVIAIKKQEENGQVLLLFREFGCNHRLTPSQMLEVMNKLNVNSLMDISLVHDKAYMEVQSPEAERINGVIALGKFFIDNFGEEEYDAFCKFEKQFVDEIEAYFGYEVVKKLNPSALFSFKKNLDKKICKEFDYIKACPKLSDTDMEKIKQQYIMKNYYKALSSSKDYAVSFLTAEWMYDAIHNGGKIDYAAIAMGYFKSIEQFLYGIASIYADGTKRIFSNGNKDKNIPRGKIVLNKDNLEIHHNYIMLDSLINFINENRNIFNENADKRLIRIFVNYLRRQKQIRNGYFHKENLEDWDVVEEARDKAFTIFALGLGLIDIPENKKMDIGVPANADQFTLLCDYINMNASSVYYIETEGEELFTAVGQHDEGIVYDEYGVATYTGIYFNRLLNIKTERTVLGVEGMFKLQKQKVYYDIHNVPTKIYRGTMLLSKSKNGLELSGPEKLIWSCGVFLEN